MAESFVAFRRIFLSDTLSAMDIFIFALFVPVETWEIVIPEGKDGLDVIVSPDVAKDKE